MRVSPSFLGPKLLWQRLGLEMQGQATWHKPQWRETVQGTAYSSPPTGEFMVSCTRTALNTGSNTAGITVIVTQPRLSSSPLMSATISAWFGKYQISLSIKILQGPQQMLILGREEGDTYLLSFPNSPSSADSKDTKSVC